MTNFLIRPKTAVDADPNDETGAICAMGVSDPAAVAGLTNGVAYYAQEVSPLSAAFTPAAPAGLNYRGTPITPVTYTNSDPDLLPTGAGPLNPAPSGKIVMAGDFTPAQVAQMVLLGALGSGGTEGFGYISAVGDVRTDFGIKATDGTKISDTSPLPVQIVANERYHFLSVIDLANNGRRDKLARRFTGITPNAWNTHTSDTVSDANRQFDFTATHANTTTTAYVWTNRADGNNNRRFVGQTGWFGLWIGVVPAESIIATTTLRDAVFPLDGSNSDPNAIDTALGGVQARFFSPVTLGGNHLGAANSGTLT